MSCFGLPPKVCFLGAWEWGGWMGGWRVVLHVSINIRWIDNMSPGQSVSIRPMSTSVESRSIQLGSFKRKKLSAWGCTPSRFYIRSTPHHFGLRSGLTRRCMPWPSPRPAPFRVMCHVVMHARNVGAAHFAAGISLKSRFRGQKVFPLGPDDVGAVASGS